MGNDLVCVTDQSLQQVVFDPREVDFSASNKNSSFFEIDFDVTGSEYSCGVFSRRIRQAA
jgi:hypothetical protein